MKYIDPSEAIKRLAAQGIDVLNLVRTAEQLEQMKQASQQDMTNKSLVDQAGQLAGTPLMDPEESRDSRASRSCIKQLTTTTGINGRNKHIYSRHYPRNSYIPRNLTDEEQDSLKVGEELSNNRRNC